MQMLNEEGDPIIEITERVPDEDHTTTAGMHPSPHAPEPGSKAPLTSSELRDEDIERRRMARNALLDQLEVEEEEEERLELAKSHRLRNSKASSSSSTLPPRAPPPPAPAPTPLKMTAASSGLVPNIVERTVASISPLQPSPTNPPIESSSTSTQASIKPKSVSFASDVKPAAPLPGAPRDRTNDSLRALAMNVVEKPPVGTEDGNNREVTAAAKTKGTRFTPRHVQIRQAEIDSDDEDPSDDPEGDDDDEEDEDDEDAEEETEEEEDWDEAMLQRELALAYYESQGMLKELRASVEVPAPPSWSADMGSWEQEVS